MDALTWIDVLRGVALIPRWPRAAVWLVVLRRWSYGEAADALGVERSELRDLLSYTPRR